MKTKKQKKDNNWQLSSVKLPTLGAGRAYYGNYKAYYIDGNGRLWIKSHCKAVKP